MLTHAQQRHHHTGGLQQELLRHALAYADAGWPVFPLRPGTKRPATPDHTAETCDQTDPRCATGHTGWEQRATTNPDRINRAWETHPWGIGIACGPAGLVVVDLDIPKDSGATGIDALRQLEHDHGHQLPATFTVATPSSGRHLYYTAPPGDSPGNTAGTIAPHIDTRGAGGYVAAPPTTLTNGNSYHIIDDQPPVELPEWFSQLLKPPPRPARTAQPQPAIDTNSLRVQRYVTAALQRELDGLINTAEGQRNHALFITSIAVGQLVGACLISASHAEQLLKHAASNHIRAGAYNHSQARKTIASGLRRGIQEPRQLPANLTTTGTRR